MCKCGDRSERQEAGYDFPMFERVYKCAGGGWGLKRASLSQSLPSPAPSHRGGSCSRSHNWKLIQSLLNGVSLK